LKEKALKTALTSFRPRSDMTWDEVLNKILDYPTQVNTTHSEENSSVVGFRSAQELCKIKYALEISTDELASYHPSTSLNKITYRASKIAYHADNVLLRVRSDLGLPPPPEELIRLFRWSFSHVVRRHEMFHYFVERGCKLLAEDSYRDYLDKVYKRRSGNLEEALADAYAIVRCSEDLKNLPQPSTLPYSKDELASTVFPTILKGVFINDNRPPGYREAKSFVDEIEILFVYDVDDIVSLPLILDGSYLEIFKGFSWLFYELTVREPKDFTNINNFPAIPYSKRDFLVFLENIRAEEDTLWKFLLDQPLEESA